MEEDQPPFRIFTRDSLVQIQARRIEDYAKKKELEKKRAEGEVSLVPLQDIQRIISLTGYSKHILLVLTRSHKVLFIATFHALS